MKKKGNVWPPGIILRLNRLSGTRNLHLDEKSFRLKREKTFCAFFTVGPEEGFEVYVSSDLEKKTFDVFYRCFRLVVSIQFLTYISELRSLGRLCGQRPVCLTRSRQLICVCIRI